MLTPLDIIYSVTYEGDDYTDHRAIFDCPEEARQFAADHSTRCVAQVDAMPVFTVCHTDEFYRGQLTYSGR